MGQRYLSISAKLIGLTGAALILFAFVIWIDPWLTQQSPLMLKALNLLPLWVVWLFLLGLFGRPSPAILVSLGAVGGVFYLNFLKLQELNQPLVLTDLLLISQVFNHIGFLSDYIDLELLCLVLFLGSIGTWVLLKTEPVWLNGPTRLISTCVAIIVAIGLIHTAMGQRLYLEHEGPNKPWAPAALIETQGWVASAMVAAHTDWVRLPAPDHRGVDGLKTQWAELNRPSSPDPGLDSRPDVVVILSESFFEPRHLKGGELCTLLPRWCALLDEGISGEMRVPTFGGNTTRTEYELLTGVPYSFLPQGIYPYTSVVLKPTASIASWAKMLGYQTTAIHPHDRYFWQRHRALPLLGFDEFIGEKTFGPHRREGFWISDHDLTHKILDTLDEANSSPQWIFAISMENHGPWHDRRPNIDADRLAALPKLSGVDERADLAYRTYLYHQRNAIAALERLWEAVKKRSRPTVVLFFGDHLPGLHETFKQAGFEDGWTPSTHPTPYLLLHHGIQHTTDWKPSTSYQLGIWLLANTPLPLPTDYALLMDLWQSTEQDQVILDELVYPYLIALEPNDWSEEGCERFLLC